MLQRTFWRYYALTFGAVFVHFLLIEDYLALGIFFPFPKISILATTDWYIEAVAAFIVALIGQLLERSGWLRHIFGPR